MSGDTTFLSKIGYRTIKISLPKETLHTKTLYLCLQNISLSHDDDDDDIITNIAIKQE